MILDNLEDLIGKKLFSAEIIYISPQSWGNLVTSMGEVFDEKEKAEFWCAERVATLSVLGYSIRALPITYDLNRVTECCITSLRKEKQHVRKEMQTKLEDYDDRISKLLSLTHQPAQEGEPATYDNEYDDDIPL